MTEMMNKTWSLYEAEKAAGNAETADMIGDAYTILDMINMGETETHRDYMEKTYYRMGRELTQDMLAGRETRAVEAYRIMEAALVDAGILEADEEPEVEPEELDYTNSAQHWDEWAADQRFDMYRDLALEGYEY